VRVLLIRVAVIALWASALPSALAQKPGMITIKVEPPTVARVEFDRRRPPADMPSTGVDGSGVCNNLFVLDSGVAASIEELSPTSVRAYPEDFDVITRLDVTIYTAKGSPPKLLAHEEGHRMIGEYYYRNAEAAAREAIQTVVGRAFEGSGVNREAAEQAALAKVHAELDAAYTARMQARSSAANARYDSLTAHGLSTTITEEEAIAKAIAEDP
jgi:hypothetical protein